MFGWGSKDAEPPKQQNVRDARGDDGNTPQINTLKKNPPQNSQKPAHSNNKNEGRNSPQKLSNTNVYSMRQDNSKKGTEAKPQEIIPRVRKQIFIKPGSKESKDFWMPDEAATHCFDCRKSFTLTKRRHRYKPSLTFNIRFSSIKRNFFLKKKIVGVVESFTAILVQITM